MILIFDLDDTLYPEITYVYSGFKVVSKHLSKISKVSIKNIYNNMINLLNKNGRGKIFDDILKKLNIYSKEKVNECIEIYRNHKPKIKLDKEAIKCFKKFKNYKKYIVTNGNNIVQRKKIEAIKLDKYIDDIFIASEYGAEKPSPHLFQKIANINNVSYNNVVYIGDNPKYDFYGIKPLGFKTIRIKKYRNIKVIEKYEAHKIINNLNELDIKSWVEY